MSCNSLISNAQIEDIYKDNNLISSNGVTHLCNEDNSIKKVHIDIYDTANTPMLKRPIERSYYRDFPLMSDSDNTGKVVKHEYFILQDAFQGKKIVSAIHPKEIETYRLCEFKEIQLDAAWDGLVVWKKMFFKFKNPQAENFMKIAIQRYLKEVKGMSLDEISKAIKSDPFSVSPLLLKDATTANNHFHHWLDRTMNRQIVIKMYKEIT
jgi:hypothetical protein